MNTIKVELTKAEALGIANYLDYIVESEIDYPKELADKVRSQVND